MIDLEPFIRIERKEVMKIKVGWWKVFQLAGVVGGWARKTLAPDQDGKARITMDEVTGLVNDVCAVLGVKPEITPF